MMDPQNNKILARAIIASQFAPPFMFAGVAVAIPSMGTDLHAGAISMGLLESLFLASQLALLLTIGRLADSSDKRTLYKYAMLGFGISSVLISLVSSLPLILALRFLQGITSAIFAATGPAILAEIVPANQRGRAYGSSIGAVYAGLTLGPLLAGILNDLYGWRAVFLAGGIILLMAAALILRLMQSRWRHPPKGAVHLPSSAIMLAAVGCLVAGTSLIHQGILGALFLLGGVVFAAGFIIWQLRLERPLLDIRALAGHPVLWKALLVQLLLYVSAASTVFMLSLFMQVALGESAQTAGQVIAAGTVLMVVIAPLSGRLADRFPPQLVTSAGLGCVLLSSFMGIMLGKDSGLTFLIIMFTLQGIGFALFSSPNMTLIMSSVPATKTSMASALGAKARSLGMMCGMLIATLLISFHYGNTPIARDPSALASLPSHLYLILSVLTALALFISVTTHQQRAKQ